MTQLRVLVTEAEPGTAQVAVDELRRAGHEVLTCHEPGAPAFPCVGLQADHTCPLHGGAVDVTLAVRHTPSSHPARAEDGVLCSLRHHVPVVVAGNTLFDPFEAWETVAIDRTYDVVDTCERVVQEPSRRHTEIAANAVMEVLRRHEREDLTFLVAVRRQHGVLKTEVRGPDDVPLALRNMIAVRISGVLRAFDQDAAGIDVDFVELPA